MVTVIVQGGEPLGDCPTSWEEAEVWERKVNNLEEGEELKYKEGVNWSWDCGFKLDYDGGLVTVNSRFYPPKAHYGKTWDGTVSIYVLEKLVEQKSFDCKTLEQLRVQVEKYVKGVEKRILKCFK